MLVISFHIIFIECTVGQQNTIIHNTKTGAEHDKFGYEAYWIKENDLKSPRECFFTETWIMLSP